MKQRLCSRPAALLALFVVAIVGAVPGPDAVAETPTAAVSARQSDPVILTGTQLAELQASSTPVDRIFAYAFRGGSWWQVPLQVDEKSGGEFLSVGDGILSADDEVVFMAKDLGSRADGPLTAPLAHVAQVLHEVAVTDPQSGSTSYAYIVRSDQATKVFNAYVTTAGARITTGVYEIGYDTDDPWIDHLSFTGGQNILDRLPKIRGCSTRLCITEKNALLGGEDSSGPEGGDFSLIKGGPVRAIIRATSKKTVFGSNVDLAHQLFMYDTMIGWDADVNIDLPDFLNIDLDYITVSTDFNANAANSTFYNAAKPEGVTVDGAGGADGVPSTPSKWWQLSTASGTFVQVVDYSTAMQSGSSAETFYLDDAATRPECGRDNNDVEVCDTADRKRYGDTGVRVNDPREGFTYAYRMYLLPGRLDTVGATYEGYYNAPVTIAPVTAVVVGEPLPPRVYAPIVNK